MHSPPNSPEHGATEPDVEWPYASLLVFGFFGTDTPAGRRLARRTTVGLAAFLVCGLALGGAGGFPGWILAAGLPVSVGWIGLAYAWYLGSLDELSRTLQLRALAFSYGAAMTLASALAAAALATGGAGHPASYLGALVAAEPLRGVALVVLARRYR